jgi:hypothetical protein
MHKNNKNIIIVGRSLNRDNLYKVLLSLNLLFILGYVSLSYFTVSNIIERKQIAVNIENIRADIGTLESEYFSKMSLLSEENKMTEGYGEPEHISFAKIKSSSAVSLANENGL